ncbi:hypothetical protein BT93_H0036 [Corymbia citriodora subsp. variegata]|nr:hypothetical protein BT93_H0036 [Corymbia citriodora subsp. variegata]
MEEQYGSDAGLNDKMKNKGDEEGAILTVNSLTDEMPFPKEEEKLRRPGKYRLFEADLEGIPSAMGQGKSKSAADSPQTVESSRPSQPLSELNNPLVKWNRVLSKDSDMEREDTASSGRVQGGQTGPLSHGIDLEMGDARSSDRVHSERSSVDPLAHEDTCQRLATMVDPLLSVNVQGAFSLVAYKSSYNSSSAKVVLLYLLVFLFVLGFLSALGGKLFRSSKMAVTGLVAAALAFLMTMILIVI